MTMELFSVLCLSLLIFLVFCHRMFGKRKPAKALMIPEPPGLLIVGHSFKVDIASLHLLCEKYAEVYGKIFQLRIFWKTLVIINDSKLIRKAFASDEYGDVFNDRTEHFIPRYLQLGFESRKERYMQLGEATVAVRKMIHKCLKVFGEGVTRVQQQLEAELSRLITEIGYCHGKDIDVAQFLRESLANSTASLLTGKPAEDGDSEIIWNAINTRNMLGDRKTSTILTTFPFVRHMPGKYGRMFSDAIRARDRCFERFATSDLHINSDVMIVPNEQDNDNVIAMLYALQKEVNIKAGYHLIDDYYILAMIYDILYVGIVTTLRALVDTFAILVRYDDCAMKIQEEIERVTGSRAPSLSDRSKMPYTRAFVLEVLRYTSHGRLLMPYHRACKDQVFEGFLIKKDSLVIMNAWFIHHDPSIWGDPYCFRPERFLDSRGQLVPPDHQLRQSVVLFSFGKRACPGETLAKARIFLYITRLLQVFELHPPSSGRLPNTDPRSLKAENYMCQATTRS